MVDIHDPPGPALAEIPRDDLHEPRKNDEIRARLFPKAGDLAEGGCLLLSGRDALKGYPFALDRSPVVLMIGDYHRDIEGKLARSPAPEEIREAMAKPRHHQNHTETGFRGAEGPCGAEFGCERFKSLTQRGQIRLERVRIDLHPGKEPLCLRIGELMDFHEVASLLGHPSADPREQADAVGAGEF